MVSTIGEYMRNFFFIIVVMMFFAAIVNFISGDNIGAIASILIAFFSHKMLSRVSENMKSRKKENEISK